MPQIRVGVGGWTYEPWRDNFYPAKWPHARELEYASRKLSVIEINSTYHGTQKRASFAKWRADTPEGFLFSVKASRYATNRGRLAESGESIERFVNSGIGELGPKLGPLLWQFMPTKRFDADDFEAFLDLLPRTVEGIALRHAMEVRHPSFVSAEFVTLLRDAGVALVVADTAKRFPFLDDVTADFVYVRLHGDEELYTSGYDDDALDRWAARVREWRAGKAPATEHTVTGRGPTRRGGRDVYVYFDNDVKVRAPYDAIGLAERVGGR